MTPRPMLRSRIALAILTALMLANPARAELKIDITKGNVEPMPIALPDLPGSGVGALARERQARVARTNEIGLRRRVVRQTRFKRGEMFAFGRGPFCSNTPLIGASCFHQRPLPPCLKQGQTDAHLNGSHVAKRTVPALIHCRPRPVGNALGARHAKTRIGRVRFRLECEQRGMTAHMRAQVLRIDSKLRFVAGERFVGCLTDPAPQFRARRYERGSRVGATVLHARSFNLGGDGRIDAFAARRKAPARGLGGRARFARQRAQHVDAALCMIGGDPGARSAKARSAPLGECSRTVVPMGAANVLRSVATGHP